MAELPLLESDREFRLVGVDAPLFAVLFAATFDDNVIGTGDEATKELPISTFGEEGFVGGNGDSAKDCIGGERVTEDLIDGRDFGDGSGTSSGVEAAGGGEVATKLLGAEVDGCLSFETGVGFVGGLEIGVRLESSFAGFP